MAMVLLYSYVIISMNSGAGRFLHYLFQSAKYYIHTLNRVNYAVRTSELQWLGLARYYLKPPVFPPPSLPAIHVNYLDIQCTTPRCPPSAVGISETNLTSHLSITPIATDKTQRWEGSWVRCQFDYIIETSAGHDTLYLRD